MRMVLYSKTFCEHSPSVCIVDELLYNEEFNSNSLIHKDIPIHGIKQLLGLIMLIGDLK